MYRPCLDFNKHSARTRGVRARERERERARASTSTSERERERERARESERERESERTRARESARERKRECAGESARERERERESARESTRERERARESRFLEIPAWECFFSDRRNFNLGLKSGFEPPDLDGAEGQDVTVENGVEFVPIIPTPTYRVKIIPIVA